MKGETNISPRLYQEVNKFMDKLYYLNNHSIFVT